MNPWDDDSPDAPWPQALPHDRPRRGAVRRALHGEPPSAPGGPGTALPALRVSKKLQPGHHGTVKLLQRFGSALVCVRYRTDALARYRYTTVELVVDRHPVVPRHEPMVWVRIGYADTALRRQALAQGATWNQATKLWHMPRRLARKLGLAARVVQT